MNLSVTVAKEYLNEIAKNPYTGSSAKELAEHLMKKGE